MFVELREMCLYGPLNLSQEDSDAFCYLPNLELLRLAGSVHPSGAPPPSAEAARFLTRLVELDTVSAWGTDETLLRLCNSKSLTRL